MIKVRFGKEISHLIRERVWHPTQQMDEEQDGSLVLSFRAGGETEILAWLYSYLPHVQLLEPAELRARFYGALKEGLKGLDA